MSPQTDLIDDQPAALDRRQTTRIEAVHRGFLYKPTPSPDTIRTTATIFLSERLSLKIVTEPNSPNTGIRSRAQARVGRAGRAWPDSGKNVNSGFSRVMKGPSPEH